MIDNANPRYTIIRYKITCPKCNNNFVFRSTDIELTFPVKMSDNGLKTIIRQYVKCPLCENIIFFDLKDENDFKLYAKVKKQYAEKHRL